MKNCTFANWRERGEAEERRRGKLQKAATTYLMFSVWLQSHRLAKPSTESALQSADVFSPSALDGSPQECSAVFFSVGTSGNVCFQSSVHGTNSWAHASSPGSLIECGVPPALAATSCRFHHHRWFRASCSASGMRPGLSVYNTQNERHRCFAQGASVENYSQTSQGAEKMRDPWDTHVSGSEGVRIQCLHARGNPNCQIFWFKSSFSWRISVKYHVR